MSKTHLVVVKEDYRGHCAAFAEDLENNVDILSTSGVNFGGVYDKPEAQQQYRTWRPYALKHIYIFSTKKEQKQVTEELNDYYKDHKMYIFN